MEGKRWFLNFIGSLKVISSVILMLMLSNGVPVQAGSSSVFPVIEQQPLVLNVATFKGGRDCDLCPVMVVLPEGSYAMGATEEDKKITSQDSYPLSKFLNFLAPTVNPPRRMVHVASFAIAKYDVTKAQFAIFAKETHFEGKGCGSSEKPVSEKDWNSPEISQTDNDPVVCVSWNDTQKYIAWLNSKLPVNKARYRLPTEEEWEYAARAGTTTPNSWPNWDNLSELCRYANIRDLSSKKDESVKSFPHAPIANCDDGYVETSPVGSFPPNPYGLYDMAGNVEQWVSNCDHFYLPSTTNEPQCKRRVFRGSAWADGPFEILISARSSSQPDSRTSIHGFRLAADIN